MESGSDGELSEREVSSFLGSSVGLESSLVLGKGSSGCLTALSSKIFWGELLLLPLILGGGSSLLVNNGEDLGNGLSNNL